MSGNKIKKIVKKAKNNKNTEPIIEQTNTITNELINVPEIKQDLININFTKPVLKWVGGKTQIIDKVINKFPTNIDNYHELFLGGGSVLFALLDSVKHNKIKIKGTINAYDLNQTLINLYINIQKEPQKVIDNIKTIINLLDNVENIDTSIESLNNGSSDLEKIKNIIIEVTNLYFYDVVNYYNISTYKH